MVGFMVEIQLTSARQQFSEICSQPDRRIDIVEGALLVASESYPGLSIEAYRRKLNEMAHAAKACINLDMSPREQVVRLNRFIFHDLGFQGNAENYYDPRNSFLNEVIDRRRGIPITLSIVYIEIARLVGMHVDGVSFPGHFLVKHPGYPEIIVDAYHGEILSQAQCEDKLKVIFGASVEWDPDFLSAASRREILIRLLTNLKHIHLQGSDHDAALECSERLLMLEPDSVSELRDRGLIYEQMGCCQAALSDLEQFVHYCPEHESTGEINERIMSLQRQVSSLH